ncbi:hypothetical protein Pmar_PMAR027507, partial [Perkinsus marinus ATCC 50983]
MWQRAIHYKVDPKKLNPLQYVKETVVVIGDERVSKWYCQFDDGECKFGGEWARKRLDKFRDHLTSKHSLKHPNCGDSDDDTHGAPRKRERKSPHENRSKRSCSSPKRRQAKLTRYMVACAPEERVEAFHKALVVGL